MKIAFLLTQNLESPSGLGRYWPLARELARAGHSTQILALHPDFTSLLRTQFELEGVNIHYVAPMHVMKQGSAKKYYPPHQLLSITAWATWKLTRAALSSQAEIFHICKPHPMNSLAGLLAGLRRDRLIFLDCDDYEAGSGNFSAGWQKKGVAWFERWVPRRVHTVTSNTHFMLQKLADWGVPDDRRIYLPNGVDQDRFRQPDSRQVEALRSQLGLQARPVVGYIGSLSLANHAVDLLLEAFAQVTASLPESRLLLVGGGEDLPELQSLARRLGIENVVHWIGRVSPDLAPAYYRLFDVSVDPVRDDEAARGRSPLKLFESWASNVPFVTGDVGERKDLLGTPPAGLLAVPGDADSLAENILQILQNPTLAQELRQRGRDRVQHYTWDKLAAQLAENYLAAWRSSRGKS
jgi:glycosyltransferase involved in cell wall biosynthesis